MKRLFEFLYPERTHLKAVIAALVAIFLLSGVLAYQVYVSENARKEQQEAQLGEHSTAAGSQLRDVLKTNGTQPIVGVFRPAITAVFQGESLESATKLLDLSGLCRACVEASGPTSVSLVDFQNRSSTDGVSAELIAEVANADTVAIAPGWFGGMIIEKTTPEHRVLVFVRNRTPAHDRGWVISAPSTYATWLAREVINNVPLIPNELIAPVRNDSAARVIFRVQADLGNGTVLTSTSKDAVAGNITVRQDGHILPGIAWTVGVLPLGREVLTLPESKWLSPNLVLILMGLIAGVIAMAIAVVRREEELHRLRSDLISGVSHELRTPLAQIRMFAETLLLGRTRTEAERRRSLEVIDQEAKRLSHFVENMLQFAKGEGGRTRLVPEHSSFAVEIRRAVESFAPMCQARGVEVRTELEEGVTAPVDRSALRRVMLNLMENALKYGPDEQRITVGTALFNDVVRVWVDDEGEGIPRADRERVFDSFHRLNRELDRRVTGSGIGLAVVRQLATLHGGRAWAEEAPGGGARLVVEFPEAYVRAPEENTGTGWAVA